MQLQYFAKIWVMLFPLQWGLRLLFTSIYLASLPTKAGCEKVNFFMWGSCTYAYRPRKKKKNCPVSMITVIDITQTPSTFLVQSVRCCCRVGTPGTGYLLPSTMRTVYSTSGQQWTPVTGKYSVVITNQTSLSTNYPMLRHLNWVDSKRPHAGFEVCPTTYSQLWPSLSTLTLNCVLAGCIQQALNFL